STFRSSNPFPGVRVFGRGAVVCDRALTVRALCRFVARRGRPSREWRVVAQRGSTACLLTPRLEHSFPLTSFSPLDIAQQITLLDQDLFQKIDPRREFILKRIQQPEASPMFTKFA